MNSNTKIKVHHNKIRNTGVLFESLARQVTVDVLNDKSSSTASGIIKQFFNKKTEQAHHRDQADTNDTQKSIQQRGHSFLLRRPLYKNCSLRKLTLFLPCQNTLSTAQPPHPSLQDSLLILHHAMFEPHDPLYTSPCQDSCHRRCQ